MTNKCVVRTEEITKADIVLMLSNRSVDGG